MKIIQKILVKQIVTEKSKEVLLNTFNQQKMQLEQEHQQLLFEQRKLQNKLGLSQREVLKRFELEHNKRKNKIEMIDFKIEQLDILPLGSEMVEKDVEALVEVSVGSDWNQIKNKKEIIIKDGIVIRIEE